MYWLHKNLFFFLKNQNFFVQNFFLLNHFNFYLILNLNKNFLKSDKNLLLKTSVNFNKKLSFLNKNIFILKYLKYFNKIIFFKNNSIRLNQLDYYGHYNNYNFYYFNNYNFVFYKKLINLLFQINQENKNFIILDKTYKNIFPLYNYVFNLKNITMYKKYFFVSSNFFTFNN
jgi:hypothetical protein